MPHYWTAQDSPVGWLLLTADDVGITSIRMSSERPYPPVDGFRERDTPILAEACKQLEQYFAGRLTRFDLPLNAGGTDFQRTVWDALSTIPHGEVRTYREIAHQIGRPTAYRAVGLANGRNPISIVVPCHRVIGTTGALTGYAGGLERKKMLLDLESALGGTTPATAALFTTGSATRSNPAAGAPIRV